MHVVPRCQLDVRPLVRDGQDKLWKLAAGYFHSIFPLLERLAYLVQAADVSCGCIHAVMARNASRPTICLNDLSGLRCRIIQVRCPSR